MPEKGDVICVNRMVRAHCPYCKRVESIDVTNDDEQLTALSCGGCGRLFVVQVTVVLDVDVFSVVGEQEE